MQRTFQANRTFSYSQAICPLPPLVPYARCKCGRCRTCKENERWDRVFAKFELKKPDERGMFQSALRDLG